MEVLNWIFVGSKVRVIDSEEGGEAVKDATTKKILLYGLLFAPLFTGSLVLSSFIFGNGYSLLAISILAVISFGVFVTVQLAYRKLNQS
ncbi:hypothetical protein [Alkalicoccobacillus porphyridii]|uniref:Uncharacterized protein n=1 Tax=Alkalicoccobacillus porphyridii TaxID=2597270 RepID=A0A553ZVW8_9BACI|nr:hypothetical protein [Alkalicoccobacillus porphyridii]TSB45582.1 hypothetical protein FN960_15545 [Alkalicoccobacillus porphyridii]